ncbi:MAG: hypothetical protein FWH11_12230 [Micrococcales bacterium]|nr:hypothetical protein [Micrococcales bacterium]
MTSPARHQVTFNDGNSQSALDPHDGQSLRLARRSDPVVLSDDPTLGQTVSLGFGEVPAVAVGGVCAAVTVGCALALATGVVHSGSARFLLVVVALATVVPALRTLTSRLRHHDGAVAIGHAGVTVHRHGKELHLAWVEIKRIKVAMTTYHRRVRRPPEVLSGRPKLQARTQILLAPAVPGGFDTHKDSGLLRVVSRRADESLVSALITYSHAVPLRHRLLVDDDHLPEPVVLVDAALSRFAGARYARPKVTRRQRPFLW